MQSLAFYLFGIVLIVIGNSQAFRDESIFEDEDIYSQALPPSRNTGLTAPGTKWCGPGNTAAHYNDLGSEREADKCCRAHDHCDVVIEPQTTLHGIRNTDWFAILKCSCEQEFINCLQNVNSVTSNTLGRIYFGARSKCLEKGPVVVSCKEYQEGTFQKRCIRYNVEERSEYTWQLYDMPFYSLSMN